MALSLLLSLALSAVLVGQVRAAGARLADAGGMYMKPTGSRCHPGGQTVLAPQAKVLAQPASDTATVTISDPFGCVDNGDNLDVEVVVNNPGPLLTGVSITATLPSSLIGVAGSCTFVGGSGATSCVVTAGSMTWTGDIPGNSILTINYQVEVGAGVPAGDPLCIGTVYDNGAGPAASITECTTVDCSPTAVDLRSFAVIGLTGRAIVVWETASEAHTLGFNVYRAASVLGPWSTLNPALVPGEGGASFGQSYVWHDTAGPGTWYYRLEDVGVAGKRTLHPAIGVLVGPDAGGSAVFLPSAGIARSTRPPLARFRE